MVSPSSQIPPGRVAALQNNLFKHLDPKTKVPQTNVYANEEGIYTPSYDDVTPDDPIMGRLASTCQKPSIYSTNYKVFSGQESELSTMSSGPMQETRFPRADSGTSPQEPGIGMIHVSAMPRPTLPILASSTPKVAHLTRMHTSTVSHDAVTEAETQTYGPMFKDSESGCCSPRSCCRRCTSGYGACFTKERWWRLRWLTLGVIVGLIIGMVAGIACTYFFLGEGIP